MERKMLAPIANKSMKELTTLRAAKKVFGG